MERSVISGNLFVGDRRRVFAAFFCRKEAIEEVAAQTEHFLSQDKQDGNCANNIEYAGKIGEQPGDVGIQSADELRQAVIGNPDAVDYLVSLVLSKQVVEGNGVLIEGRAQCCPGKEGICNR